MNNENNIPDENTNCISDEPLAPADTPSPKQKKFSFLYVIVGLVVVLAVAAAVLLKTGSLGTVASWLTSDILGITDSNSENRPIFAEITADGIAYIPLMDGSSIKINDEVVSAVITPDRKHIVVWLEDGSLYFTDKDQSSKTQISSEFITEVNGILSVRNDGFFCLSEGSIAYRVLFDGSDPVNVGAYNAFVAAPNNTTALYFTDDGNLYTLANTETIANKIATVDTSNGVKLRAVSDNGQISVWSVFDGTSHTIMLNDGYEKITVGKVDSSASNTTLVDFSKDQELVVIIDWNSDCTWIKRAGEDLVEAKVGADLFSSCYTEAGTLSNTRADKVSSLYLSSKVEGYDASDVYNISLNGDRERILSKVHGFAISNGNIIYTDLEYTLYYAKLSGNSISEEIKIASDVNGFEVTNNGKYVYYMKDCENDQGTLYCYKFGEADSLKIASDVACTCSDTTVSMNHTDYSVDGSDVFFFKDVEKIQDHYTAYGTLMTWSYGEENPQKIAGEVMLHSVDSYLDSVELYPDSFTYMKYFSVDDENIYCNWMYYNGKESSKIASDIIC